MSKEILGLNQQLDRMKQEFVANSPAEVHMEMFRMIREIQQQGIATGLPAGAKAKDFLLPDSLGEQISLYEELAKGPVFLTFYRGGWCPYCNLQLRSYEMILPEIKALGGQLIAVSPQTPDNSLSQVEKEQLTFRVLSDNAGLAAASYDLLFDVPDYIQKLYQNFGINLAEYNAAANWKLPVPATFMIDEHAIIRSAYVNADFMKRMEPNEILAELAKL